MKLINRLSTRLFIIVLFIEAFLLAGDHAQKASNLAGILFLTLIITLLSAWFTYEK